jgi:hypothetical protein
MRRHAQLLDISGGVPPAMEGELMETIKIREVRAEPLERAAGAGRLLAVTRDRALIAIFVPMVQAWLEHVVEHNWSRLQRSAELDRARNVKGAAVTSLDAVLEEAAKQSRPDADAMAVDPPPPPAGHTHPLGAAAHSIATGLVAGAAQVGSAALGSSAHPAVEFIRGLSVAFGLADDADRSTSIASVGIRELSADRIEQAGRNKEILVLTNDRVLTGLVVPVTQQLVELLVEKNLSRVMHHAEITAKEASEGGLPSLDHVLRGVASGLEPAQQPAPQSSKSPTSSGA